MSDFWLDDDDDDQTLWQEMTDAERDAKREEDTDKEYTEEELLEQIRLLKEKEREPVPYKKKVTQKRIAVLDTETDPFALGVIVKPFALGFLTDDRYVDFWGDNCVDDFFEYLATLEDEFIIYAHNGGKFDFYFLLKYLDPGQTPLIMNSRLVKINFAGQEFRDSFAIIPQGLGSYQKDKIDYDKFTRDRRENHKQEIRDYLKSDCVYLRELIVGFHDMFGDKLTIASATFNMLRSYHGFAEMKSERKDDQFRHYYYGGRNQCFEQGELRPRPGRKWRVYDRNSMYPAEMRDTLHPIGNEARLQRDIDNDTDFACIEAINDGCLPMRLEDGGLDFTVKRGKFFATMHEIKAGLDTGTLKILNVRHAYAFDHKSTFADYVNHFYGLRLDAKAVGDKILDILYKYCLNTPYGKFALNPAKFKQYKLTISEVPEPQRSDAHPKGWSLESRSGDIFIWSRPNPRKRGYLNVATAASITGASRANLLRNLALAKRPIYCDTDSIICEDFAGSLDDKALGGWKLEGEGDLAAIGGKKTYALFSNGELIKKASKGVTLSGDEIRAVCRGETIRYDNPVPKFNLDGSADFISRNIRMTGKGKR